MQMLGIKEKSEYSNIFAAYIAMYFRTSRIDLNFRINSQLRKYAINNFEVELLMLTRECLSDQNEMCVNQTREWMRVPELHRN